MPLPNLGKLWSEWRILKSRPFGPKPNALPLRYTPLFLNGAQWGTWTHKVSRRSLNPLCLPISPTEHVCINNILSHLLMPVNNYFKYNYIIIFDLEYNFLSQVLIIWLGGFVAAVVINYYIRIYYPDWANDLSTVELL